MNLPPTIPLDDLELELAQRKLSTFVKQAWHTIEPDTELVWNWHHDAICEYLTAVCEGEIRNLLVTVPPRHTKSTITSIMLAPWVWIHNAAKQFLYASHDHTLSIEHSVKCRRVIESPWYSARWGNRCKLAEDQNEKRKCKTAAGGGRTAASVGGSVTGKGGDIVIVDDPHKVEDADAAILTSLKSACAWFDGTLSTRLNDPQTSCKIVIMQRIHQGDLAGHVLGKGGWAHLNLPTEAEQRTVVAMPRSEDVVREEGALLWPGRFGAPEVAQARIDLGSWKFAAQHQQRPAPAGGGILKRSWWRFYKLGAMPPEWFARLKRVTQSWDTGCKQREQNDPSVCLTGGEGHNGFYITDLWKGRVPFPDLVRVCKAQYLKHNPHAVLVEDASSGISLVQSLQADTTIPVLPIGVDRDKVARAHAVSPTIEAGNVWLPEDAPWLADFLDECDNFPNVVHDDQVDALTQLLSYFLGFTKNVLAEPQLVVL